MGRRLPQSQAVRQSVSQAVRQSGSQAVRQSGSQAVRQSGSQAVRQTDRQTHARDGISWLARSMAGWLSDWLLMALRLLAACPVGMYSSSSSASACTSRRCACCGAAVWMQKRAVVVVCVCVCVLCTCSVCTGHLLAIHGSIRVHWFVSVHDLASETAAAAAAVRCGAVRCGSLVQCAAWASSRASMASRLAMVRCVPGGGGGENCATACVCARLRAIRLCGWIVFGVDRLGGMHG